MAKTTTVNFPFTARRIEMALQLLTAAIDSMTAKKAATTNPAEAAFYEQQTPAFQAFIDLLVRVQQAAGKAGATRKTRLTEAQFQMLIGSLSQRGLNEVSAVHKMADGPEKDKRLAALGEWQEFREALEAKDPRKFDTSQDAEDEDEDEDSEADE